MCRYFVIIFDILISYLADVWGYTCHVFFKNKKKSYDRCPIILQIILYFTIKLQTRGNWIWNLQVQNAFKPLRLLITNPVFPFLSNTFHSIWVHLRISHIKTKSHLKLQTKLSISYKKANFSFRLDVSTTIPYKRSWRWKVKKNLLKRRRYMAAKQLDNRCVLYFVKPKKFLLVKRR